MEAINLSESERGELTLLQRSRTAAVAQVRRARLILLLDEGASWSAIKRELGCDSRFIATWGGRFVEQRLAGLFARHPGRAPLRDPAKLEARVLERTLKHKPRDGSTHWSSRKLAAEMKLPFMTVQRIWRKHNVQPHRVQRHMISNDPDFEAKAADVIGLYLNPPAHAAVFCVDEKTAIQALDRKDRMLPLSPGRAESHGIRNPLRDSELALQYVWNQQGRLADRHPSRSLAVQPPQLTRHAVRLTLPLAERVGTSTQLNSPAGRTNEEGLARGAFFTSRMVP